MKQHARQERDFHRPQKERFLENWPAWEYRRAVKGIARETIRDGFCQKLEIATESISLPPPEAVEVAQAGPDNVLKPYFDKAIERLDHGPTACIMPDRSRLREISLLRLSRKEQDLVRMRREVGEGQIILVGFDATGGRLRLVTGTRTVRQPTPEEMKWPQQHQRRLNSFEIGYERRVSSRPPSNGRAE